MKEVETKDVGGSDDAVQSETGTVPGGAEAAAPEDGAGPQLVEEAPAAEETVARAQYEQLKAERDQLVDRLARMQAEFENARKRTEREKAEYRDYAAANVVEQFLPVLDNFELALRAKGSAEQLRSGVELIVKQMEEVLRQMNVTPVPAVGEEFNPHHHEALGSVERDDLPDQHVAEEIRRGYKMREKLLRPAMVRVVSNPKQTVE
ncbi:MAG TPA: nucleotide exchange factor GrpE [Terracidiphilus sp.]